MIFALDATMSRQPTCGQACSLQADIFREAAAVGGLDIQLVYYRGLAESPASPRIAEPERLGALKWLRRTRRHVGRPERYYWAP